jgi:eukaryotic-like serine/threonine-protein kinase
MLSLIESPAGAGVLRPGQVVGAKYRVERLLGEGGMAAVWAGTNIRTSKQVALKVMLPVFAAMGEAMELFRREALAASKVNHPNVVNIFDVVEHDGMTCIVMEFLEGETLAAYLAARGPLPLAEALTLLLPAMRGVAAANERGVIHRDLKPGNLFICKDPEGRVLTTKVLDFGISMCDRPVDGPPSKRMVGPDEPCVRFGTPAYMAPEDVEYPQMVDSRTDVYGFGVLLFETLTGTVPFSGPPSPTLFRQILEDAPPKITALRADLPFTLQLLIDRALAKRPSDRFPDLDHFVHTIEEHLLAADPGQRPLSPTLTLGRSSADESQGIPLATVTSAGDSGPTRIPTKAGRFGFHALLERRTLAAGLIVGVLLASPWLALHGRGKRTTDAVQPSHAATAPLLTRLPALSATPDVVIPPVAPEPVPHAPVQAMAQRRPQLGHADVRAASVRGQKPARATSDRRRAAQSRLPASPRAGKLSTSDF